VDKKPYNTKAGLQQFKPVCTMEEYHVLRDDYTGFCLACGETQEGVEPDGRAYECETCKAPKVFGLEELSIMGLLVITDLEEA
jgi:hypothetical protein